MAAASPKQYPDAEYTEEVRFAVVMYGGVSLAIYINGIAQELLRLVRATATAGTGPDGSRICLTANSNDEKNQLKGTEKVYRKLSYLLADKNLLAECRALADNAVDKESSKTLVDRLEALVTAHDRPINVRFIVDILSGTSAGGINAIYLAKALANEQNMDKLKRLWITEGDIGVLINDKRSVAGLNLDNQEPPQSLLNSRRMYLKLLEALNGMETPQKKNGESDGSQKNFNSPYVDEIDLFITTTDIAGMPVPIRLSDTVVYERRHRNVFHFKYASKEAFGDARNDFDRANNPFLAFAARCTSSFPFAFEPMRLSDIDEVLDACKDYRDADKEKMKELKKQWLRFFKGDNSSRAVDFTERSFGDGGYLDNKPFTYATETLARRYATLPVDRKLIYIEPSPEHPEDARSNTPRPDALANVKAALLDLPAYETIREDLQRLMQRNDLINRINGLVTAIDHDLDRANSDPKSERPPLQPGEWETLDLAGMVDKFGVYYLPYRRLRIAAVTDALAELVTRVQKLQDNSAESFAVGVLIRAWREEQYPDYHPTSGKVSQTANQLLLHYDFAYWLRRLNFIRRKVDLLYRLQELPSANANGDGVNQDEISEEDKAILNRFRLLRYNPFDYVTLTAREKRSLHELLVFIRSELKVIYTELRLRGREIQGSGSEVARKIKDIPLTPKRLRYLLYLPENSDLEPDFAKLDEEKCLKRAHELLRDPEFAGKFQDAADTLRREMEAKVVDPTWTRCRALFRPTETLPAELEGCIRPLTPNPNEQIWNGAREYLWRYFSQFDDFDQISFPIMYGLDEGESDVVEVIRISPEDATTLINERREKSESADGVGRRKLAGTALHHFGAFLDRTWRQNDIMWGRLDGAERLITSLLPNDPADENLRKALIKEAHTAILIEEMSPKNQEQLRTLVTGALVRASAGEPIEAAVKKVIAGLDANSSVRTRLESVISASLKEEELLDFITSGYEVNRGMDAKMMLRAMSRSTQVIGKVFEDIANQNSLDGKSLAWMARLGQIFWGLVEVAVPGSILNLLMIHWLKLLYVLELALIIISFLFSAPGEVQTFTLKVFAITVATNLAVLLLRDKMRGRKRWQHALVLVVVGSVLLLAGIGVADLFGVEASSTVRSALQPVVNWYQGAKEWLKPLRDWLAKIL
ncbi:MAG TPA: patatin-like protein [Pyrinomonadaceae bacterium]|nr:patatin-like protein [Pyrinomonadaceae bacterium]